MKSVRFCHAERSEASRCPQVRPFASLRVTHHYVPVLVVKTHYGALGWGRDPQELLKLHYMDVLERWALSMPGSIKPEQRDAILHSAGDVLDDAIVFLQGLIRIPT